MQNFQRSKTPNAMKLQSGFRLIPIFSVSHNAVRLRHHIEATAKCNAAQQRAARRARLNKRINGSACLKATR